jgi:hypothetical protein
MKISELLQLLQAHPNSTLTFHLPDREIIPLHAHVTEVGKTERRFIDCGGTTRIASACTIQMWVANDVGHRLTGKDLGGIFEKAAGVLGGEDLNVEIEYEDYVLSQYPIARGRNEEDILIIEAEFKHTECLAKEVCFPEKTGNACCGGDGCC